MLLFEPFVTVDVLTPSGQAADRAAQVDYIPSWLAFFDAVQRHLKRTGLTIDPKSKIYNAIDQSKCLSAIDE